MDTNIWYKGPETYFAKEHSDSKNKYPEYVIIKMLEFLVVNIFVNRAKQIFKQTVGLPSGYELSPSSRRQLSLFIRSGIHAFFA